MQQHELPWSLGNDVTTARYVMRVRKRVLFRRKLRSMGYQIVVQMNGKQGGTIRFRDGESPVPLAILKGIWRKVK